jgi:hypothetical protein
VTRQHAVQPFCGKRELAINLYAHDGLVAGQVYGRQPGRIAVSA